MSKQTDISKSAAEYVDNHVECICDPNHYAYGTGTCWFHLSVREQATSSFEAGAKYALECPEVIKMQKTLRMFLDYTTEKDCPTPHKHGREALAAFDRLAKGE